MSKTTLVDKSIIPANEKGRLNALKRYEILDTPPDGSFDRITAIASMLLNVPIVIVSLVDEDRIWFKSKFGLEDVEQINRDPGLCASAILTDEAYVITNAIEDPRSLANPLVAGDFGLRFYAAAPLKTQDNFNLGTLCLLDTKPRELTEKEIKILENLAAVVMDEMELRLASRKAYRLHRDLLSIAAHDMKSPLSGILEGSKLLKTDKDPETIEVATLIGDTTKKMLHIITELLESNYLEEGKIELNLSEFELSGLINEVIIANKILAKQKKQQFKTDIDPGINIIGDQSRIYEVFDNIINNAIKYSPAESAIEINLHKTETQAIIRISDQGQGLSEDDKNNLFKKFCRLSSMPTGGETQTGLGLSIVKTLLDLHNGEITAESEGKNKGTTFIIKLPLN